MDDVARHEVAEYLERLAGQPMWNPELWQRCYDLVGANWDNELQYVHDDLIHYSGVFHSHNIFGFRRKPRHSALEYCRQEFRDIAAALRSSLSLSETKKKYDLSFEGW